MTPTDEVLTISEIEARFASEWILLEDPQTDAAMNVTGGAVRFHSKDRDQTYRRAVEIRPKRFAILYTGSMAANTAIVV